MSNCSSGDQRREKRDDVVKPMMSVRVRKPTPTNIYRQNIEKEMPPWRQDPS